MRESESLEVIQDRGVSVRLVKHQVVDLRERELRKDGEVRLVLLIILRPGLESV
jgi:hypothetical protein